MDAQSSVAELKVCMLSETRRLLPNIMEAIVAFSDSMVVGKKNVNSDPDDLPGGLETFVSLLVSFDSMQPPSRWVEAWAAALVSSDMEELAKHLSVESGLGDRYLDCFGPRFPSPPRQAREAPRDVPGPVAVPAPPGRLLPPAQVRLQAPSQDSQESQEIEQLQGQQHPKPNPDANSEQLRDPPDDVNSEEKKKESEKEEKVDDNVGDGKENGKEGEKKEGAVATPNSSESIAAGATGVTGADGKKDTSDKPKESESTESEAKKQTVASDDDNSKKKIDQEGLLQKAEVRQWSQTKGHRAFKKAAKPADQADKLTAEDLLVADMVPLSRLNGFSDLSLIPGGVLHDCPEAYKLGLEAGSFSSQGLVILELRLQALMWKLFDAASVDPGAVLVNIKSAVSKDRVQVKRPVPESVCLPFVGPVVQSPTQSVQNKSMKLCDLFGMQFWVTPLSADVTSHQVMVPAWSVKTVAKSDQAFFARKVKTFNMVLSAPLITGKEGELMTPSLMDVDVHLVPLEISDEDVIINWVAEKFPATSYTTCFSAGIKVD